MFIYISVKAMLNGYVTFDGSTNQMLIGIDSPSDSKVVASANQNVNVWVSYNSGWYINVSDSSFVGNVFYSVIPGV